MEEISCETFTGARPTDLGGQGRGWAPHRVWGRPVLVVDPEGPMSAGRRGALEVENSRGDSRPGGGGVEEGAGSLAPSGWVFMASGSVEGSWRTAG